MRKIFLLIAISLSITVTAQDYLVSFIGTGTNTSVDTVQVINLTHPDTLMIAGSDILHLISWSVGIPTNTMIKSEIQVYPTPIVDQATFKFTCPSDGNVNIMVIDMTGESVYSSDYYLYTGENTFKITGVSRGMYLLKISGKNYSFSTKLISVAEIYNSINISHNTYFKTETTKLKSTTTQTVEMEYQPGDRFQYKGFINGNISVVIAKTAFSSMSSDTTVTFRFLTCKDVNGHNYATIQIQVGDKKKSTSSTTQTWMAENLNVGTMIDGNVPQGNNPIIEKYCYNNDTNNCNIYGGLYMWDEMMQYDTVEGIQGICPSGWRLPTLAEWDTLVNYYGGVAIAESSLKETGTAHWLSPNSDATNESGFTAFGAGCHDQIGGFGSILTDGYFWTSTHYPIAWNPDAAWFFNLQSTTVPTIYREGTPKASGFSVRCVHD